jgi:hypothetical protein
MKRTYFLAVLVLIAGAYVVKMKYVGTHAGLEAAKERIRNVAQQPIAHQAPARPAGTAAAPAAAAPQQGEPGRPQTSELVPPPADNGPVTRLTKGTFTQVDGTLVYSADAQLDIGHGMLVSSPSGVMVSDESQEHISGDLVVETQDATTTMENAFITVDRAHVESTSDSSVTVKKEEPK